MLAKKATSRIIFFLVMGFFLSSFVGCQLLQKVNPPPAGKQAEGEVVTLKLEGKPPLKGTESASSFTLSPNTEFEGILYVENEDRKRDRYLLTFLLDYKQTPLLFDGKTSLVHRFSVNPFEKKAISIKTGVLTRGFHDLTLLLIPNPDKHSLDHKYRLESSRVLYIRSNLFVGSSHPPLVSYSIKANAKVERKDVPPLFASKKRKVPFENISSWFREKVEPRQSLHYFIHTSNPFEKSLSFSLVVFLNYKQIPLSTSWPELVRFGKLEPGEGVVLPADLVVPEERGIHELIVLWIPNPYEKLSEDMEVRFKEMSQEEVQSTLRVGLVIE